MECRCCCGLQPLLSERRTFSQVELAEGVRLGSKSCIGKSSKFASVKFRISVAHRVQASKLARPLRRVGAAFEKHRGETDDRLSASRVEQEAGRSSIASAVVIHEHESKPETSFGAESYYAHSQLRGHI
jgi:hypothetical protein